MKQDTLHKTQKFSRSHQTRQHIISSYLELIRGKKWDKISVIEICKKAEITRGTFYQYFGDIYDLLEQLEGELLEELKARYHICPQMRRTAIAAEDFPKRFDYAPPQSFLTWFDFCRDHREAMLSLLDRKYGDTYFVKKLKVILRENAEIIMDSEGTAKDELRTHFVEVFVELHLLSVQTWLSSDTGEFLSVDDIVNLLNTMRVGAMYLTWKGNTDPEFEKKMKNVE